MKASLRTFPFMFFVLGIFLVGIRSSEAQSNLFANWPEGRSPEEVGKRVAERFVISPHMDPRVIVYPEVCAWYGALKYAGATNDKELVLELVRRFDPLMTSAENSLVPAQRHVDFSVSEWYRWRFTAKPNRPNILISAKALQIDNGRVRPVMVSQGRRAFGIDDMYMITMLQVEAYRVTGDHKYIDRASTEMVAYLEKLQEPNGLFYHAPDVPFFWARGDGWVAAGMAELLTSLPKDDPRRPRILAGYKRMMSALLKFQGKDGMWRELIDHEEAWPETSSTGMFAFAMITGIKSGWLDQSIYGSAARKAWLALVGYIDQNDELTNVCQGTAKKDDLEYYLLRKRRTGDFHGQGAVLWAAAALVQ